jgi:ankyrin repeat protein
MKIPVMKILAVTAVTVALATGAVVMRPSSLAESSRYNKQDIELFWRESQGPNGERSPAAMPLYQAVMAQDRKEVERLLEHGTSANILLYPQRFSPLMVSLSFNDRPMVELLLKHGANLNYVSDDVIYTTPLVAAFISGRTPDPHDFSVGSDFSLFWFLIDAGADINLKFKDEDIAIYAAGSGRMKLVNELLARGYHRDLPRLRETINIVAANNDEQPELHRALATIDRLLK